MSQPRFSPIVRDFPHFLHGGDYNPEQWMRTPEVWDEDFRLLRAAHCNTFTVGVFSWSALEPAEGEFQFDWLDTIFQKALENQVRIVLATPTAARPAWLAAKYPEVLRTDRERRQHGWGGRHNHCLTSPVYRQKADLINTHLARRYGGHPMLSVWHVNNEYSGECHCALCQNAFRAWLQARYRGDLDALNLAYWAGFWGHTYTDWTQIESPSPLGEHQVHGLNLDWKRFITDQTIDFFRAEAAPLREITPDVPVTTNYIGGYAGLDYYKIARELDVVSWDSYPDYHDREDSWKSAVFVSFLHAQRRAMLGKPFLLMECSPGVQNYKPFCKLKRPGLHLTECLQSIAAGADSILYFQWRKSLGSVEKFHGAVIDHFATDQTRVFGEVAELGRVLESLGDVVGTSHRAEVAIIYDYENRWAIEDAAGPRNKDKAYAEVCTEHFRPFWQAGVSCDIISEDHDFTRYKLLIAPMLYMIRPGVAERIEQFVKAGGTFVTTFLSGLTNESDLCFQNGFPGPLRELMGVWAEEIDALYDDESVAIEAVGDGNFGLSGTYEAKTYCDLLHAEGAEVLATYAGEFYAGRPALTVNKVGDGRAFYVASRNDTRFASDFYHHLIDELGLRRALGITLPDGVTADVRFDGDKEFIFLLNFRRTPQKVELGAQSYTDRLSGQKVTSMALLPAYGSLVLQPVD